MNKKTFLEQLKTLISFKTLSDNDKANNTALDFIISKISPLAFIKVFENEGARILLAGNFDGLEPDICFLSHIDVVAAPKKLFKMKVRGDFAFGRGVSDMKFSIPIGIDLLNDLLVRKSKLSFSLVVTTDEEIGGFKGAKYLVDKLKFKPKALIVPDGGNNLTFVEKAKGVCQIKIESFGASAHSSQIFNGKNAIEPLVSLINQLLAKYGERNQRETWRTTMNIGRIYGGDSTNQVCDYASCSLDFRFPQTTSVEKIFAEVKKCSESTESSLQVSLLSTGRPTFVDVNLKIVKRLIRVLERETGSKVRIGRAFGASDARHFVNLKIPVLMVKPNGGNIHSEGEFISIPSCLEFSRALHKFLINEVVETNHIPSNSSGP